ncbi:hypothetical protein F5Y16DRAFT_397110 [Xylariaceae sp. FL0255]|nr:hypothetical protein F5Y16DRAFT_397110 [Xylariaceae sp. FL0255]
MSRHVVPRAVSNQVIAGARVNIVLKADQPTGKLTQGVVQDVLTAHQNHPRGLKVRLRDGQIGRVQSIISESAGNSSADTTSSDSPSTLDAASSSQQIRRPRYRDVRLDELLEAPAEQADLGAYIVPSRRQGKGKKGSKGTQEQSSDDSNFNQNSDSNSQSMARDVTSALVTCPVCGAFEGDETAVAHHVAAHFE